MPASRVVLQVPNGLRNLSCLACGAPVFTESAGAAEHTCDHVRFFIDPSGELSLADPDGSTGDDQARQQAIVDLVEATESWDDFLTRVVELLPASAVVIEISEPATGDDDESTRAVIAIDLAAGGQEEM